MRENTNQENYKYGHFSRSVGEYQLLNKHKQIRYVCKLSKLIKQLI